MDYKRCLKEEKASQLPPKVDSQMELKELPVNYCSKGMTRGEKSDNGRDLFSIGYWEGFRKEGFSGECQP